MTEIATRPFPSAVPPSDEELAAWLALSRSEQMARYREVLLSPEAARVSPATMDDILVAARRRVAARRG